MPSLEIQQLTGGIGALLGAVLEDPTVKSAGAVPNAVLAAVCEMQAKRLIERSAAELIKPKLQDAYDWFVMENGEYPATGTELEKDEWESACDDVVEKVFEPYDDVITSDFTGAYTVDTQLHLGPEQIDRIATKFGQVVYQTLSWRLPAGQDEEGRRMTPDEVCEACGLRVDTIKAALAERVPLSAPPEPKETKTMEITDVTAKLRAAGLSRDDMMECLESVADTDDGLALSAAQTTFNGDMTDVATLRAFMSQFGPAGPANVVEMVTGEVDEDGVVQDDDDWMSEFGGNDPVHASDCAVHNEPAMPAGPCDCGAEPTVVDDDDWMADFGGSEAPVAPAEPEPAASPAPPPPKSRAPRKTPTPADAEGAVPADVLMKIKTSTGAKDEDIAALAGCSRATWNNYLKGKGAFVPDDEQRGRLTAFLDERMLAISEARDALSPICEEA